MRSWLLEAAALRRQEEQVEDPPPDPRGDPWAVRLSRCMKCGQRLPPDSEEARCVTCRPSLPRCSVKGCRGYAKANGRCYHHPLPP